MASPSSYTSLAKPPTLFTLHSSCLRPPPALASQVAGRRRLTFSRRQQHSGLAVASLTNSAPARNGTYKVGDFMTRKEDLLVVKPSTGVDQALEVIVEKRITGFPVIDDHWNLVLLCLLTHGLISCYSLLQVGFVSDYDLLALDSISGCNQSDNNLFPDVDSTWKAFNEIQKLLGKTNGKVVGDLMTPNPLTVRENTNLEDAVRLLLETKYRRLPVVDGDGKLVGLLTRGTVVRAALQMKRESPRSTWNL
ncbi:unnamed protein product [Linum tenue]|uniref:CBS domain-containing protein n=1 Tax=Linum tenue TaxID=586396 RepID=A0AAV0RIQ5_9ROSI|nr:unnamed protein product [Linum tenue]